MMFQIGGIVFGAVVCMSLLSAPTSAAPAKPSSETSAARICFDFEMELDDLVHWCTQALTEVGLSGTDRERAHNNLGWLYAELGEFEAAQAAYNDALALNPLNGSSYSGLGWVYWELDDFEQAREYFTQAVDLNAGVSSLAGLGSTLHNLETDLDQAQSFLKQAILIDPEYGWAVRQLAWLYADLGNFDEADANFDKAIAIHPGDAWAYYGKSTVAYDQNNLGDALDFINTALGHDENTAFLSMRALVMNTKENYRQAISDASRALELTPDYGYAARQAAKAHRALGHQQLAKKTFADAAAAGASGPYFYSDYADLMYDLNLPAEALPLIVASLSGDDQDPWAHNLHSAILFDLARYPEALAAAERALAIQDEYAYPYINIAYSHVALGNFDAALEAARQAQDLDIEESSVNDFIRYVVAEGHVLTAIKYRAALQAAP